MNTFVTKLVVGAGFAVSAVLMGACTSETATDPTTDPTTEPAPAENVGTAQQAYSYGPPSYCTYKQNGHYQYFMIGCSSSHVGTWELFRCVPNGGGFHWVGQPQVGYQKKYCAE